MHQFRDSANDRATALAGIAHQHLGGWVNIRTHDWNSLYVWHDAPFYNAYGDVIGHLQSNTVYLDNQSNCLYEDLFHELGHAVARMFNLIGHQENGFIGDWEKKQSRLIGNVQYHRHWSNLLHRLKHRAPFFTTDLASEIWAELFMYWHLHPDHAEIRFIEYQMKRIEKTPELHGIAELATRLTTIERHQW